jgi:UTP--glucose-1-phosphate uridylyltransferase
MKPIKKAVILAAWYGTSFLPATKALPKEMLTLIDKPIIQYLVEDCVAAGIEDLMIVTGRGGRAIEEHFDVSFDLQKNLVEKGKYHLLSQVEEVSRLANIAYVRQREPRGDGDALLRTKSWIWDEPCVVLFGDELIDNDNTSVLQLLKTFEMNDRAITAGIGDITLDRQSSYGVVELQDRKIAKIFEKPQNHETESTQAMIGKFVVTKQIFDILESMASGRDGRISIAEALNVALTVNTPIIACKLEGTRFDVGDKSDYIAASIHYALKRDDMRPKILACIQSLV